MNDSSEIKFSALDRHFARLMGELAKSPSPELELAAKLTSFFRTEGHICLPLKNVAGQKKLENFPKEASPTPPLEMWLEKLKGSSVVGVPGDFAPLILDAKHRLYLRRYWEYEYKLAQAISKRVAAEPAPINLEALEKSLDQLFPKREVGKNWQRLAAFTAVTRNFCVISGGPGTGKTRTVVIILALLLQHFGKMRIALCAPTGKAAARLKESIENTVGKLELPEEIRKLVPNEATTIHRLLGSKPDSPYFRRNQESPLVVDAVIVDEASMVDLALMSKLFDATPPSAKMILLGDKDQLASVEAGAVLGEICAQSVADLQSGGAKGISPAPQPPANRKHFLAQHIVELKKNYRFGDNSGIFRASQLVNVGQAKDLLAFLQNDKPADLSWQNLPRAGELKRTLRSLVTEKFSAYLKGKTPAEALAALNDFRILCAVRRGPFGVEGINYTVEEILDQARLIQSESRWYHGRPVMITQNEPNLKLFNGDIGIVWRDVENRHELRAYFASSDGSVRRFLPSRLPAHETVFAMTVHKSQGSEFKSLLFILPDRDNPVLTRELIYTGLTRAREHVEIWANETVFCEAVAKRTARASGLRDALGDTQA